MRIKGILVIILLALLCVPATRSYAQTFTLVKTIDLIPLIGGSQNNEVDVVGNELYVQNWEFDKYFRIDPGNSTLLGSFALSSGILMDNHGSDYNFKTGTIYHVSDDDAGGTLAAYDAFFQTDINGVLIEGEGPYDLFGPGDNSEDPEGLAVDPFTGRVWVSMSGFDGIYEIDPSDATILNQVYVGYVNQLAFNPINGKLVFDANGQLWEIAPDGTGLEMVDIPGTSVSGMAFTPAGDLVLLASDRLFLYDSSDDTDNVFTTAPVPVTIDIKPGSDTNCFNQNERGVIPVAILGSATLDVSNIDFQSLLLQGLEVKMAGKSKKYLAHIEDVNGDGYTDLVVQFEDSDDWVASANGTATLTGELSNGTPIQGSDSICIVP